MLKALMIKRSLDAKRAALQELLSKDSLFATREAELEQAISEVEDGNEEQQAAVMEEIDKLEADQAAHEEAKTKLSADIEDLESQLEEIERKAPAANAHVR